MCVCVELVCVSTCLALVEVVQDLAAEALLALPLALRWVVQELPQGTLLPGQQLPVQQQGERRLWRSQGDGAQHGMFLIK